MKRVRFDHCVLKPLRRHLTGFEIRTCYEEGWDALRNGELLAAAEAAGFDVFMRGWWTQCSSVGGCLPTEMSTRRKFTTSFRLSCKRSMVARPVAEAPMIC